MTMFSDLLGTLVSKFKIGITGVTLKNSSENLLVRNASDTADANVTAAKLLNTGNTIDIGTTNVLTISKNATQSGPVTIIYPAGKSTDGQVLAQKAGTAANVIEFEFVTSANTSQCLTTDTTSLAFGSGATIAMFNLPAAAIVEAVRVVIDTTFNGTPSISVGIAGTASKYLASNQVDLTAAATTVFEVYPGKAAAGSVEALQIAYTAGSATAGAARVEVDYVVPA
jgi:hypothetical protein